MTRFQRQLLLSKTFYLICTPPYFQSVLISLSYFVRTRPFSPSLFCEASLFGYRMESESHPTPIPQPTKESRTAYMEGKTGFQKTTSPPSLLAKRKLRPRKTKWLIQWKVRTTNQWYVYQPKKILGALTPKDWEILKVEGSVARQVGDKIGKRKEV